MSKSGKVECPICNEQHILEEHHINGRNIPNSEHPSNKAYICSNCHTLVHENRIVIEGWFNTSKGKKLFWHKTGEEGFTGKESHPPLFGKKKMYNRDKKGKSDERKTNYPHKK